MTEPRSRTEIIIAAALFAAGLVVGILIGTIRSSSGSAAAKEAAAAKLARAEAAQRSRASAEQQSAEEATKLVLGDITRVPFQELYSVLSSRPAGELMELAQQLKALPTGHEKEQKSAKFFKAWAHFDANAAMKAAASMDTPAAREKAISAVVDGADATAAESLAHAISELPADALPANRQRGLAGMAATKWSEINAAAAAAFIDTLPVAGGNFFADMHTIAANWAASDPQAALAWAQRRDSGNTFPTRFATNGAISGWWQKDPAAAEAYVVAHLSTLSDRQLASSLASQMFNSDPKHAMEWVSQLPNVEARRQADSMIAHQLGWTDPKGAAEWAASLPEDVRSSTLNSAVGMWAQSNPAAAAEWLGTLSGSARDQAVSGYSSSVAMKDPANALTWATTISDPRMRDSSVERIVRTWIHRNPNDATAWVQSSALSEDQKKRLLATTTPPGG